MSVKLINRAEFERISRVAHDEAEAKAGLEAAIDAQECRQRYLQRAPATQGPSGVAHCSKPLLVIGGSDADAYTWSVPRGLARGRRQAVIGLSRAATCFGAHDYVYGPNGEYETSDQRAERILCRELGRACRCARRDDWDGAGAALALARQQPSWCFDKMKQANQLLQAVEEALRLAIIDADGGWPEYVAWCMEIARKKATGAAL